MGGQGFIFEPSASSVALNPLSAALTLCYHDTWDLLEAYFYLGPSWDLLLTYYLTLGSHISSFAAPILQTGPFKAVYQNNLPLFYFDVNCILLVRRSENGSQHT